MNEDKPDRDALIDAMAALLELRIEPEYRPGIALNLDIVARFAGVLFEQDLGDQAEPAPVFRP